MDNKTLEICCFSLESCLVAQASGADRIELCSGFNEGGITPSIGLVKEVLKQISIPVMVMIRPRGGNFCYSDLEIKVMLQDIEEIKKLKPAGFVFGCLTKSRNLDLNNLKKLKAACKGYDLTFHRAFDDCLHPLEDIEQIIELGFHNILTSGQAETAILGKFNILKYLEIAQGRMKIMAGAGILPSNIQELLFADAYHLTAKKCIYELDENLIFNQPVFEASGSTISEISRMLK